MTELTLFSNVLSKYLRDEKKLLVIYIKKKILSTFL